jgi:hypothetical protein
MNLRILRTVHTETRDYPPGMNVEFPDATARLLIARGQAEDADTAPAQAPAPAVPPKAPVSATPAAGRNPGAP